MTTKTVAQPVKVGDRVKATVSTKSINKGGVYDVIALSHKRDGSCYVRTRFASVIPGTGADRPIQQPFGYLWPGEYKIVDAQP